MSFSLLPMKRMHEDDAEESEEVDRLIRSGYNDSSEAREIQHTEDNVITSVSTSGFGSSSSSSPNLPFARSTSVVAVVVPRNKRQSVPVSARNTSRLSCPIDGLPVDLLATILFSGRYLEASLPQLKILRRVSSLWRSISRDHYNIVQLGSLNPRPNVLQLFPALPHFTSKIFYLDLSYHTYREEELLQLLKQHQSTLIGLNLTKNSISAAVLSAICEMRCLKYLNLSRADLASPDALSILNHLSSLSWLSVEGLAVTDAMLEPLLRGNADLTVLIVRYCHSITARTLVTLASCRKLKKLDITACCLLSTRDLLALVKDRPDLPWTHLACPYMRDATSTSLIAVLQRLPALQAVDCRRSVMDVHPYPDLHSLQEFCQSRRLQAIILHRDMHHLLIGAMYLISEVPTPDELHAILDSVCLR